MKETPIRPAVLEAPGPRAQKYPRKHAFPVRIIKAPSSAGHIEPELRSVGVRL